MDKEFIYSIDGNLKENIIENLFGKAGGSFTDQFKQIAKDNWENEFRSSLNDIDGRYKKMLVCIDYVKKNIVDQRSREWPPHLEYVYNDRIKNIINDSNLTDTEKEFKLDEEVVTKDDKFTEKYGTFFREKSRKLSSGSSECKNYIDDYDKLSTDMIDEKKRVEDNMTNERYSNKYVDISDLTQGFLNWYENTYNNMVSFENETFEINVKEINDNTKLKIIDEINKIKEPVDCEFTYGKCNKQCKKYINITSHPRNNGTICPSSVVDCNPGEDKCPHTPVDCKEAYSECQIINDTNAPSNIKGKCSKKNIIYKNSAHGGKLCKNETYVRCNDGEGSCPSDCKGIFSYCASNCKKKYKITSYAKNGGKECDYNNDQIIDCKGDNCIESIDCVGSWSNCDSNCEKTWNITTKQQGNGQNCRFSDGLKRKCTEDDDNKCKKIINKDCVGKFTTCDSECKKEWIIEDIASGSGTCDYSENTKYDCKEGVGNCLVSKDCIGRWKTCDENCKSKWELLEKEQGKNGRCDLIDGQEKSCVHGEGLCVINENNTTSTTDLSNDNNDNISQESKDQQMILYAIIALLSLIIIAVYI